MSTPIFYLFRLLSYDLLPFYKKTRKTGQFDLSETVEITVGVDRQDTAVHIHRRDALLVTGFHSAGHQLVHLPAAAGGRYRISCSFTFESSVSRSVVFLYGLIISALISRAVETAVSS